MKTNILSYIMVLFMAFSSMNAQDSSKVKNNFANDKKHQNMNFVDKNGDGYNDNAPDHDGDGIPNGLDPDYIKLKKRKEGKSIGYVDSDGDGINDNLQFNGRRRKMMGANTGFHTIGGFNNSGMGNGTNHGQKGKKGRK